MTTANTNTEVVWTLSKDMPLAIALFAIMDKAERFGKGSFSASYWCEELLSSKLEAYSKQLDAGKELAAVRASEKEINAIPAPPPLDIDDIDSLRANAMYADRIKSIRRKHGIGFEQKTL